VTETLDLRIWWNELGGPGPVEGVVAATVHGAQLSAARYVLEPDVVVPEHSHANEEFGQVLAGSLELRCAGLTEQLAPGDAFIVPGDLPHSCTAGSDGCELIECYAPPRVPQEQR
jgi:quercetin dioxygenase-like cupin family protein